MAPTCRASPTLGQMVRRLLALVPELPRLRLSSIDSAEIDADLMAPDRRRAAPDAASASQPAGRRRHDPEAHEAPPFARRCASTSAPSVRGLRPDIAFGADLIAGFPTETEEMFENTLDAGRGCGLAYLHVFPFSARAGTPAARMPQLPRPMRKERAARLRAAGDSGARAAISPAASARTVSVLVETDDRWPQRGIRPIDQFALDAPQERVAARIVAAQITGLADGKLIAIAA